MFHIFLYKWNFSNLKVDQYRFENLSICLYSYKNNILKISHSES